MPIVRMTDIDVSNDNSPETANVDMQVDLALLLSEFYGKNIRQGQNFVVDGIQAWIRPADEDTGEFIDVGVSAAVKANYYPTTSHSRKAWNNVFKQWATQKRIAGAVGTQIRYDDMEFSWNFDKATTRTSTIRSSGIGDSSTEKLVLTGQSTGSEDFSLEDYYNSAYPAAGSSRDHFSNLVIKENKFGSTPFPRIQSIYCAATNSARLGLLGENAIIGTSPEGLTSAIAISEMNILPTPVNVLCGILNVKAYVMPDDTADQIEEDMVMDLAFSVKSWKPLVFKRKTKRWMRGRKKSGKRGTRFYGRRYNRRRR